MTLPNTIKKHTPTVLTVTNNYPASLTSYAYFFVHCLIEEGYLTSVQPMDVELLKDAPSPESFDRIKRKLVSQGTIILPKDTVKRNKKLKDESIVHYRNKEASAVNLEPNKIKKTPIRYEFVGNEAIPVYQ